MKKGLIIVIFILHAVFILGNDVKIQLGIDVFLEEGYKNYTGKKLGLITNQTGLTSDLKMNIDEIDNLEEIELTKLFCPEHGIRGVAYASEKIDDAYDIKTGIKIYSLYGNSKKPTPEMLTDIDVLLYDIQDIGARTYTYIYTMAYAMQAAAENNKEFVVLDRPIPVYGNLVDGNILEEDYTSFIGMYPIPYVYGMTCGELARFFNEEFAIGVDLKVVAMKGYSHEMDYADTGLHWIPTSPHIPTYDTAYYYSATGSIGELGTISNGVGYTTPFKLIGREWIDGEKLAKELNAENIPGCVFKPVSFKPFYTKFRKEVCSGVQLIITNKKTFKPYMTQLYILEKLYTSYQDKGFFDKRVGKDMVDMFEKSVGTSKIREYFAKGDSASDIIERYQEDLLEFKAKREKYLLYN